MRATAAAAAGGALGALARWAAAAPFDLDHGSFPWVVLVVNAVGCLGIGLAATRLDRGSLTWTFVVTGVLGGFTTMSGFAVGVDELLTAGRTPAAVVYVAATLGAGAGALAIGERAAR